MHGHECSDTLAAIELRKHLRAIETALNAANVATSDTDDREYPRPLSLAERIAMLARDRDEARRLLGDTAHRLANEQQVNTGLREQSLSEEFLAFLNDPQTLEAIGDAKASVMLSPAPAMTGVEQTRAIGVLRDLVAHILIRKDEARIVDIFADEGAPQAAGDALLLASKARSQDFDVEEMRGWCRHVDERLTALEMRAKGDEQ